MPDGSSGRMAEVTAESDRVVLRRLAARPKPRKTTLLLGVSQMVLGLAIVAISFTAFALSTSNRVRNACPYWAGFSVLLTGGVGLIAWKQPSSLALSFFTFLSAVCVVLHLVATALSGLSGADLQTLVNCKESSLPRSCLCCESQSRCMRRDDMISFEGVEDCSMITTTMKELMYSVCVTNIVACVICIAATIIGCAYIVKRHTTRRMVVRRSQCSNLARDSFFSDIIMPTDSIFTPPVAPPPPYSPPEYTAISNDRVLVESNEFMDDMSTPTPVIGPMDMPPPYSTLDLSPGGTIECAVAQEYQVEPSEIHHIDPRRPGAQTAISNSYNPGRAIITIYQRNNTEQIPTPPLRWDSHHVTRATPVPRMEQSGCNAIEPHHYHHHHHHRHSNNTGNTPAPVQIVNNNRRHVKGKSRPRSSSSGGSPRAGQQRQEVRPGLPHQIIPQHGESSSGLIIVNDGVVSQQRLRSNSGGCLPVVIMRHHRNRAPQGNRVSTASQTSLEGNDNNASHANSATNAESINVGDRIIPSIPCSVSLQNASSAVPSQCVANLCGAVNQRGFDNSLPSTTNNNVRGGVSVKAKSGLMDRKASSSSGSVSGPTTTSVPSNTKSSSSNERLTGTSSSHTSRDSAIGRRHRRRHSRHATERRRVSSSTTCSTSPTESSSRSSGSIGHGRRTRNRFISTSSSSDSEEDHRHPPPPRRMITRMANGAIRHEMLDQNNAYGFSVGAQREQRHRKGSGSSANTPPRGRAKQHKASGDRSSSGSSRRANSSGPPTRNYAQMAIAQAYPMDAPPSTSSSMTVTSLVGSGEQIHLRQKRPNSLNLRLSRKSHPAVQLRRSNPAAVAYANESDPWIHKDTGRTYASVGVQSTPEQNQSSKQSVDLLRKSKESPMRTTLLDNPPPEIQSSVSAPTPSTVAPDPMSPVPKPKPRPKSMVELSQDTSVLVSRFLKQSIGGLSPAIKTVLEDIQSVITNDEQYLAEALQSQEVIDGYIEKAESAEKLSKETDQQRTYPELPEQTKDSSHLPSPQPNPKDLLKQRLEEKCGTTDEGVLPISETKFQHSCPDADLIGTSGTKHEALLQGCLAKSLESARETVL